MKDLIIATQNLDKFSEMKSVLEPLGFHCLSLNDIGFTDEVEEDGYTFFDNAFKKAKIIVDLYHLPTLGDDSGLIVNALPNRLGVRSRRFSKEATYSANNELLLKELDGVEDRSAYFMSVIVACKPDGSYHTYDGTVTGHIAHDYKGDHGFGYDPLFVVDELNKRMAELTREEKNKISHRGRALQKLIEDIKNETIDL